MSRSVVRRHVRHAAALWQARERSAALDYLAAHGLSDYRPTFLDEATSHARREFVVRMTDASGVRVA
jgi:hypothetical protein